MVRNQSAPPSSICLAPPLERVHHDLNLAIVVEGGFQEVDIKRNAEGLEIEILLVAQLANGYPPNIVESIGAGVVRTLAKVHLGDVLDVLAVITTLGNREGLAGSLSNSSLDAEREVRNLRAGIVVVELAADAVAGPLEQRRNGVAQGSLAAMPHVQGTSGIGRDELNVDPDATSVVGPAIVCALRQDAAVHRGKLITGQPEVYETRPGDLGSGNQSWWKVQLLQHSLGGFSRIGALSASQDHGEISGEVAMSRIARAFEHKFQVIGAQSRSNPRQLRTERIAHSEEAFPSPRLRAGLAGASAFGDAGLLSVFPPSAFFSGFAFDSEVEPSVSGFRGPLPSLP